MAIRGGLITLITFENKNENVHCRQLLLLYHDIVVFFDFRSYIGNAEPYFALLIYSTRVTTLFYAEGRLNKIRV